MFSGGVTKVHHCGQRVQGGDDARVVEAAGADEVDAGPRDQLPPGHGVVVPQRRQDAGRRGGPQGLQRLRQGRRGRRARGIVPGPVLVALSEWMMERI